MTDFILPNNQSLRITFIGSDIMLRATTTDSEGFRVSCGGSLLGSGKMTAHANPQQIALMLQFAPLARGEYVAPPEQTIPACTVRVPLDRPDDALTLRCDQDGQMIVDFQGQDMGMAEHVTLHIPVPSQDAPYKSLYHGLQHFLACHRS